jgi:hypothetical protein
VDNQIPVIDSIPAPLQQTVVAPGTGAVSYGTAGPGYSTTAANYSPIWHVSHVSFNAGVTPQPLTSVQAIQQAASAGQVTITPGRDIDTFNCPVPFYYQFGTGTTPTATPTYIPPGSSAGTTTGATTGVTTGATTGVTTTGTTTAGSTTSGMTTGATTTGGTTGGTTTGSTTSTTGFPY